MELATKRLRRIGGVIDGLHKRRDWYVHLLSINTALTHRYSCKREQRDFVGLRWERAQLQLEC